MSGPRRIALIGLGEVGTILAEDLAGHRLTAWDIRFADPTSPPSRSAARLGLSASSNAAAAVDGATLVISAVTASADLAAVEDATMAITPGAMFLDLNSASPGAKRQAAARIEAAGGRYVEAAVMSPFPTKRLGTPTLLGGPHAAAFLPIGQALGFSALTVFADRVGPAAAAKLCRSIMVKGIEALLTESLTAARHYGVEATVLESLGDLLPGIDWRTLAHYMIGRSLEHGARRAEEMREAALTVAEAGLPALMAVATAERQDWAGARRAALDTPDLRGRLDRLIALKDQPC